MPNRLKYHIKCDLISAIEWYFCITLIYYGNITLMVPKLHQ